MTTATPTSSPSWATPAAKLLLPADAPREQWLDARRGGIGGSDTSTLLGDSPYQSLYGLWLDKMGIADPLEQSDPMRRGNWLEPHLADWFVEQTGIAVRRCGLLVSRERDHLRTTPDRLTADGGLLEIKTVGTHPKAADEWKHGGIARHAYDQGQQQLAVTGRSHVWFVVYQDPTPQLRGPVERDEPLIAEILEKADRFWVDHVLPGIEPVVDLETITDDEIKLRWPTSVDGKTVEAEYPAHTRALLDERDELKDDAKAVKARLDEVENALKVMVGDAEALTIGGRPVMTYKTSPRAGYTVAPTTTRKLHVPAGRAL